MTGVLALLLVFYAGAVVASSRAWLGVWRGAIRFSELRDVTGIGDPATLRRLFGLTSAHGRFKIALADVMRHRRPAGIILTNIPVHALFFGAVGWALFLGRPATAAAIVVAASLHAAMLALAAASILIDRPATAR
jgi:hypothetical protein